MTQNNYEIEFLGNGQFEYVQDRHSREMLLNAWQAITTTELWDFVKQDIDSFMFSHDPRVTRIYNKMEELGYGGHSGASFGFTMRNMQYLAEHGEEKFKTEILKTR
jgi:nanoRNase/pAp phosphatase (c-di-AMP/oligoRNAs hydrolase)